MKTRRKRTRRGHLYQAMAEGAKMMHSPLAGSFEAAAEHFEATDPPQESPKTSDDEEKPK